MDTGKVIQYVRVSTVGQNTARQINDAQIDKTFTDKCSASTTDRPELLAMLEYIREGDTVVVHEISRLARNTQDLLALVRQMNEKGVTVKFLKEGLTFGAEKNDMSLLVLTIIGAISSFELSMINERRAEGQQKAREEGRLPGRPSKLTPDQIIELKARADKESKVALAKEYGISRATLYTLIA